MFRCGREVQPRIDNVFPDIPVTNIKNDIPGDLCATALKIIWLDRSALDLPGCMFFQAIDDFITLIDEADFQWHLAHGMSGA